jgi:hypothetical protein
MDNNENKINLSGLQISPMIWRDAINASTDLTHEFSKLLLPNSYFKKWLEAGEIEHESLNISFEEPIIVATKDEFTRAIRNDYFYKVGFIDKHKTKHVKTAMEELTSLPTYKEEHKLFYIYKVKDLDHFVSLYFQHWLIFNTYFYWVRWQLYLDFIIKKSEKTIGGLYEYKWAMALGRIEGCTHAFETVDQYKQFRDKLDRMTESSKFVENEFIRIRDSKDEKRKSREILKKV